MAKNKSKKNISRYDDEDKLDGFTAKVLKTPGVAFRAMRTDSFQVGVGIIFIMFSIYMIYVFTSYLFNGAQDQSLVQNPTAEGLANMNHEIGNHGGSLGAIMSEFLINGCFGVAAYFIPVFLFVMGLKLVRAYTINLIKWFICLSVLMYWFSVALSIFSLTTGLFDDSFLRLGGNHGLFVSRWLLSQIGYPGVLIGLATVALIFFIYVSSETIYIIRNVLNPSNIKIIKLTFTKPHSEETESTQPDHTEEVDSSEEPQPEEIPTQV
ncbi:MAG: DNA translocase FtsK 4TM domain-containing protein, partial [Bacteroidaceae bacterium]|nr:DNA translocase FtsK 4TM domain-containing protein [Bacteroidaceae bacterium]